jgi:hypothetical protein
MAGKDLVSRFEIKEKGLQETIHKLANDDMCMATPALAGDRLLIRTAARLKSLRPK